MSPQPWPDHLLTLAEWEALPEDTYGHAELAEGVVVMPPRPAPRHQVARANLTADLDRQLPPALRATQNVEVIIEPSFPATVRAPDVLVISEDLFQRDPPRFDAAEVLLAVEIVSPGTRRTDHVLKAAEYAEAGIPYYWIVDLAPASLTTFTLSGGEYVPTGPIALAGSTTIAVDVSRLTERDYCPLP